MDQIEQDIRRNIKELLDGQKLAVLSTQRQGQPYSSLMAFACTDDLQTLLVATGKATRKHGNILEEARVSLLVDNRSNKEDDFDSACAVTILGTVSQVEQSDLERYRLCYLSRHPYLEEFLESPSTAFLKITVHHYLLVTRFQKVMELHLGDRKDLLS